MNVKKIVVDELPNMCIDCKLSFYSRVNEVYICFATKNRIANSKVIPDWCPLEVEEVCEWVLDYHMDDAMWDIAPSCCVGEFSMNKPKYEVCPSCGKRIKYVESEE